MPDLCPTQKYSFFLISFAFVLMLICGYSFNWKPIRPIQGPSES